MGKSSPTDTRSSWVFFLDIKNLMLHLKVNMEIGTFVFLVFIMLLKQG